ncbi:MAG: pitrilysin family protein [Deltaproteobacteria bacterium]|nr:pitrilysin family protein [Deltaproteobacteria bacterium]
MTDLEAKNWEPPKVEKLVLKNGAQLFLLPDRTLPLFKASVFFKVGSAYEETKKTGLADLTASLLVRGGTKNKTPDQLDAYLDARALVLSEDVSKELTTISVEALGPQYEKTLHLLQEVLLSPRWDEEKLQFIKRQIDEGLRRDKDQPFAVLSKAFREEIYGNKHPWGRHVTKQSIKKIKKEEIISFYETYFQPSRMTITVAGDFSSIKVKEWFEETFGPLSVHEVAEPQWEVLPLERKPKTKSIRMKQLTQVFIEAGHLGPLRSSEDVYPYELLQSVLGGDPFTSRLGKDIRVQQGLAYSVGSSWDKSPVRGVFSIDVQTRQDAAEKVLERIRYHLGALRAEGGVTAEELQRAKEEVLNQYIFWFDSPFKIVNTLARLEMLGYPKDYLRDYPQKIKNVSLEEITAIAKQYILPEQLTIVTVGPK